MKQGTFSIENGIPIIFAYGLPKPNVDDYVSEFLDSLHDFHKALKEYESSRKEWEITVWLLKIMTFTVSPGKQVEFEEITPPTAKERGKCKIVKIN
jgi:hypothetical protein